MFARKLFPRWRLLCTLPLIVMSFQFAGASPAAAEGGATEFNIQTTVPVSNINVVERGCVPPSPIDQNIRLNGDFVIQAHVVLPPSPVTPPSPIIPTGTIVTLHLDATRISGVGLANGALYRGRQGTSQNFESSLTNMIVFNTEFELVPSQPNQMPPSPVCPVQLTFQVQLYETEPGFPAISANLNSPD
jgi:hypothetical protein